MKYEIIQCLLASGEENYFLEETRRKRFQPDMLV